MIDIVHLDGVTFTVVNDDRVGYELMFRKRLKAIEILRFLQGNNLNLDYFIGCSIF